MDKGGLRSTWRRLRCDWLLKLSRLLVSGQEITLLWEACDPLKDLLIFPSGPPLVVM